MGLRFSVIIPTFERRRALGECLAHLAAQSFAKDRFEIIVVDDGSHCNLQDVVKAIDANVKLVEQANLGPAAARNRGARIAKADILVFTDDDCLPEINWLHELNQVCQGDCLVAGRTKNFYPHNRYAETTQMLLDFLYAEQMREKPVIVVASNNMAVFRDKFLSIGGFDESFDSPAGEDRDLTARLIENGLKVVYCDAQVAHASWLTATRYIKQHYRYGRGAYLHHQLCKSRHSQATTFQTVGFYARLLLNPLRVRGIKGLPNFVWTVTSQLAHSTGYVVAWLGATTSCLTQSTSSKRLHRRE